MRGGFFYALLSFCVFVGDVVEFLQHSCKGGDGFCRKIWLLYSTKLEFCGCCKHVFVNDNFPCSQQAFSLPRVWIFVLFASESACCVTWFCSAIFVSLYLVTKPNHTHAILHPVCGLLQKKENKRSVCSLLLFGDCFFCTRSVRFARIFVLDCCIFISVWFWQLYQQIAVQNLYYVCGFLCPCVVERIFSSVTFSTLFVGTL